MLTLPEDLATKQKRRRRVRFTVEFVLNAVDHDIDAVRVEEALLGWLTVGDQPLAAIDTLARAAKADALEAGAKVGMRVLRPRRGAR